MIKAAVSVPVCTNIFSFSGNMVGGKYFSDSSPVGRFQLHVEKALAEGAEKIIVFDNWHKEDNSNPLFWGRLFTYARNSQFRKNQLAYMKQIENFSNPTNIEFVLLGPREKLGMSRFEIDNANARKIFQRGYDDTFNNLKLKVILNK